jgi:dTDP-4-amino-4,6-dideoxygalactose transaminase
MEINWTTTSSKPAIFGGSPIFQEMLPIIKPTLFDPDEIMFELRNLFSSGNISNHKYVRAFEESCAQYLGVKHAVAVSSATSGLILAVKGLGLKGEVLVPSFTFTATVHSLIWNNIKPVFVDCEEGTYNIDVTKLEDKITSKTSAIMAVYTFGSPPRIRELEAISKKYNLKLIFDSAQGFGAEYEGQKAGGFGDCEVFSLSPTKVLTAIEGGLVTTNNDELAEFIRKARDYGKSGDDIEFIGINARMSEFNALVGLRNLKNLESHLRRRRQLIELYKYMLGSMEGLSFQSVLPPNKTSANYMVIFINDEEFGIARDPLYDALKVENIQTKKYFYPAVHAQSAYASFGIEYLDKLPVTEKASRQALALPLYAHMHTEDVEKVCTAIKRINAYTRQRPYSEPVYDI